MSSGPGDSSPAEEDDLVAAASPEKPAARAATAADVLAVETAAKALMLAGELSKTLEKIAERLESYAVYGQRSRRIIIGLMVSFSLDIILTVIVAILTVNALGQASTQHQSQLTACASSNQTRAQQIQLWEFLFKLAGPSADTPQDKQLLQFVRTTFKPVNCAQVYHS